MVRKDKKRSIVVRRHAAAFAAAALLAVPSILMADSVASKNAKGNRLFAEGKFEEAEKAYLEAQVKNPGKPEILYNLGNSLIKQKKYEQGLQSLRQSIDKGDKETKEKSWYNTGNALYSMGRFKESAEAYIQALRLNPADGDAKHNLELALMKLKQQPQADSSRRKPNPDTSTREQASPGNDNERPQQNKQASSGNRNKQNGDPRSQRQQEARREGSISREQALQILDAVLSQEREQQRKMLEGRARREANEKDW